MHDARGPLLPEERLGQQADHIVALDERALLIEEKAAVKIPVPADAQVRADRYWRDGAWSLAADAYLQAAEGQTEAGSPARARLILRAAAALLLAGKADEVVAVKTKYGPTLAGSPVAALFERITAPDAGVEVLAQPDVSAEIVKRD